MSRKLNKHFSTPRRKYLLKKDEPDKRDFLFQAEKLQVDNVVLPASFDLRSKLPPILDQGQLGTCAANQISNALRYCLKKNNCPEFQPSRLFLYYFARLVDGSSVQEDTGITIRSGLKSVQQYGVCGENNWGYDITKFTEEPNNKCIVAGQSHTPNFKYIRVQQNLINIKQAIFAGFPVVVGIQLYTTFESDPVAQTGTVPMPNFSKEACLGGHAINLNAWDDKTQRFTCANSWSDSWGDKGYFTLPYEYILNSSLCSDLWIVTYFK